MKIGIIGMGFVGSAVNAGFCRDGNIVSIADPKLGTTIAHVLESNPEVVFVCVPTPMGENCVADTSIVESVFEQLKDYKGIAVLKSTVVPTVVQKLELLHPRFVYNPEFLTEANSIHDFLNPFMHVFGGNIEDCLVLEEIYANHSNCAKTENIHRVSAVEAALIKYGINSFLATKVTFMNQWSDLCNAVGANYDSVAAGVGTDPRIGSSHMKVPGTDGKRGFSGSCFPKDIPAIVRESMNLNVELTTLRSAWNANCVYRTNDDRLPREIAQHIRFDKI